MDGYAVRSAECLQAQTRLQLAGRRLAGQRAPIPVPRMSCVRIMTGAEMIPDCDAVVIQEQTQTVEDGTVLLGVPVKPGQNVRRRGEHVRRGEVVLRAGRQLRGPEVALMAALGLTRVMVRRALRVGVMSSGSELVDPVPGIKEHADAIFDSNRPMLRAALASPSFCVVDLGICPDDPAELARRIERAEEQSLDVILCSGGAAQGDADVLRQLPDARFIEIPIRPGRGLLIARAGTVERPLALVSLPGNAVAAYTMMHLIVRPWLLGLLGVTQGAPAVIHLPIADAYQARTGRLQALRGKRLDSGHRTAVGILADQGSAMVRSLADADMLVLLGTQAGYEAGDLVPCLLLDSLEGS